MRVALLERKLNTMQQTDTQTIVHNWNFAADFPELPPNLIERPHFLQTMVDVLNGETPVLFLEGSEGDGATTTLAQFCHAYPSHSFSLFIKPACRFAYSLDYLRLALAEQFYWYVYGERLSRDALTESDFDSLKLKVLGKERDKTLYFVVDGLHQIPAEDRRVVGSIFADLLPTGLGRCRLIVTGQQSILSEYLRSSAKSKPYQLLKLKLEECKSFLSDTGIDDSDCRKIYELCKNGSPGRLAVVRRLLMSGMSLSTILDTDPTRYLEFVKLEFEVLKDLNEAQILVVASVAFSKMSLSVNDLTAMTTGEAALVQQTIAQCQFLRITSNGQVEFISETHRLVASNALERLKRQALTAQLAYLQENPRSEASLRFLPVYFEMLNQQEAILELLSKEYYGDLLESTQSFSALRTRAEMGAKSAASLHKTHEVFKFSLQRSIFSSASTAEGSSDRIKALVAMGKTNTALALANAEATKEDRLVLLSAFARRLTERNGKIEPELLNHIGRLIQEVNFEELGDKAVKIAADVLIFDPDAAIGIIESAVKGATAATKDSAYAELSFSASLSKLKHRTKIDNKAQSRISDEALQQVTYSFELMAERLDAEEIVNTLSKMPAAHQVFFLCSFVSIKRRDPKVLDLVELGLDTIIREAEYIPRAKDLADLCSPFLERVADHDRLRRLVTRFDSQLGLVAKAAHSKDLAVLEMRLASAEYQYDRKLARDRIEQAYFDISDIKTPEVQMECFAIMLGALSRLDVDGELEKIDGFRALVRCDLAKLLEVTLRETADHISTVSPVLKVLAADDCEAALLLASKLNTLSRRDEAYQSIANVLLSQTYTDERFAAAKQALDCISSTDHRARATMALLGALDSNPTKAAWVPFLETLRKYLMLAHQLSYWDCWMLKASVASKTDFPMALFVDRCKEATSRAESPLEESKINFRAAEALAETEPAVALKYYDEGTRVAAKTPFSTAAASRLYALCLSLVGRSMAPLARAGFLDEDKLSRHLNLIHQLPSIISRIRVLNDFAERMWCAKRRDLADRVVSEQLRPLLEESRLLHPSVARIAIAISFPSFCASHIKTALPLLNELSDVEASGALFAAAMLRLRHLPEQEPDANGKFDHSRPNTDDIIDVIEMLQVARTDSTVYGLIKATVEAINDKVNRTRFTAQQKADWSAKLKVIVVDKLPDSRNIQHAGYKVVCMALVYSLVDTPWPEWELLEKQTDTIDNCADRSYIFVNLAVALPSKYAHHRKRLLERALVEIKKIPSPIDRMSHLQDYAEAAYTNDAAASARECLKSAMKLSIELENNARVSEHRRELIDIADQIDPGLANELIELVDDDPARIHLKLEAKQTAAIAKAKREMANARQIKDMGKVDLDMLPMAAWKNLGALEAGRLEVKPLEVMTELVTLSGNGSLFDAYPVLAWHLTNMERKFLQPQDVTSNIIPVCEALLLSAELTHFILSKVSGRPFQVREDVQDEGMLVRRKTRAEALTFIEKWLREKGKKHITYCDAYFSTKDIPLIRLCLAHAPDCKVFIIASKKFLAGRNEMAEEPFKKAWREQSDQNPPETEIIALAYADAPDRDVVHDRWLLTESAGLRLGTSFNSLGEERLSEVSEVDSTRVSAIQEQIDKYISRQRVIDGARIQYSGFTLY
jgi:hypothetical protein